MNNEAQIIQAVKDLDSAMKKQLNRNLAAEALLEALIVRLDPRALAGLAEEYDAAVDRLAADIEPNLQRPYLWARWSTLIADLQKSHQAQAKQRPADTDK